MEIAECYAYVVILKSSWNDHKKCRTVICSVWYAVNEQNTGRQEMASS